MAACATERQMTNTCTDMQVMFKVSPMHRVNVALHELFQALSDPYRIRIVKLMLESKSELCLCELSEALAEPEYKLSRHVKILKNSGLIASVRDGKWIYHSLVKNQTYLKAILKAVSLFPDSEGHSKSDSARFKKRAIKRVKGRCTVPSRVTEQQEKRV